MGGACLHPRLVDGGYVDNLATAQPLGQLQRRHPARTPLRTILVSNTASSDPMKPIKDTSVANLFTDGRHDLAAGLSAPSPVIFAAKWKDITMRHLDSTTYVNVREVSTTTVENAAFGVVGGVSHSPIDLLILSLDGPIPLPARLSVGQRLQLIHARLPGLPEQRSCQRERGEEPGQRAQHAQPQCARLRSMRRAAPMRQTGKGDHYSGNWTALFQCSRISQGFRTCVVPTKNHRRTPP